MSHLLINRSWDLQKLQNEGYELEIKSGFLLVKGVPYVNSRKEVQARNARREAGPRRRQDDAARRSRRVFCGRASLQRGRDGDRADQARQRRAHARRGRGDPAFVFGEAEAARFLPGLLREDGDLCGAPGRTGPAHRSGGEAANLQGRRARERTSGRRPSTTSTPLRAALKSMWSRRS